MEILVYIFVLQTMDGTNSILRILEILRIWSIKYVVNIKC